MTQSHVPFPPFHHIFFSSDHAGYGLKTALHQRLKTEIETAQKDDPSSFKNPLVSLKSAGSTVLTLTRPYALYQATLVVDDGCEDETPCDYPDRVTPLVAPLRESSFTAGILICGSGIGISMAANRHPGLRAALCTSPEMSHLARAHNNANILALGARFLDVDQAEAILFAFLQTPFSGDERHNRRLEKLDPSTRD